MKYVYSFYSLILIFSILVPTHFFGDYDTKRVLQIILFTIVALYFNIYSKRIDDSLIINKKIAIAIVLIFIIGMISSLNASKIYYSLIDLTFQSVILLTILMLTPIDELNLQLLTKVLLITAVSFSILYLFLFFSNYIQSLYDSEMPLWPDKFVSISIEEGKYLRIHYNNKDVLYFAQKRMFNHVQTFTIPLITGALLYSINNFKKITSTILLIALSGWWMLLFGSGARGSILGLLVGLIIMLYLVKTINKQFYKVLFTSLFLGFVGYLFFFVLIPETGNNQSILRSSSSGRIEMWVYSLELWLSHPIFGIGPYHFAKINEAINFASPHNLILTYLTEWGIIAVLIIIYLINKVFSFIKFDLLYRNNKSEKLYLNICISWSFTAAIIHSLVSSINTTPLGQLWGILILAWIFGQYQCGEQLDNYNFKIKKSSVSLVLTILVILLIFQIVYTVDFPVQLGDNVKYPRFWEQGKFY